jgi:quinol monooxygenase YgiN
MEATRAEDGCIEYAYYGEDVLDPGPDPGQRTVGQPGAA